MTKETQVHRKDTRTVTGKATDSPKVHPTQKNHQTPAPPVARNGLLRPKEAGPVAPNSIDIFAKPTEYRFREPDLREERHNDHGWTSEIKRDGKVQFADKPVIEPFRVPDITELVMWLRGDPLRDPQKRKYLKSTKEIRVAKADAFTREKLTQSLNDLAERLAILWFDEKLSLPTKRQRLFDMWEECAEEGPDIVLVMSEIIRASIMSFINHNMPKNSEVAYTADDLVRLNKNRKSKAEFNPYG